MQRPELPLKDQLAVLKTSLASGYKPSEVEWLTLRSLHQQCVFVQVVHEPASFETPNLTTFQFKRPDGSVLHYCPAVIDIDKPREAPGHPHLKDWLNYLKRQIQERVINPHDLILAPLLQVQLGRHHFNTMALYVLPNNEYRVLLIEPRDNNFTLRLQSYPIDELKMVILAQMGRGVMFANITIGQQSLTDDVTCGKHQINYTEILACLPAHFFQDPERLVRLLKQTSMLRRYLDAERLFEARHLFELGEHSWDEILAMPGTQAIFQRDYHRVQNIVNAWSAALNCLQQYVETSSLQFGLFKKHTRQLTGIALMKLWQHLIRSGMGDDDEWRQATHYKLIELVFAFYSSISSPQSQLRLNLEAGLVYLLNAAPEYDAVLNKHASPKDRARVLEAYFFDRLVQLRTGFAINQEKLSALYAAVLTINKLDIGMTKQHKKIDGKRVLQFERLKESVETLLILSRLELRKE